MAKDAGLKIYFRTTPKLRGLYNRLTGELRATDAISSKRGYTSNDAIINALLMWAAEREPEELARELGPYLAHFEGVWDEVLAAATAAAVVLSEAESRPEGSPRQKAESSADPESFVPPNSESDSSAGGEWVTGSIRHRTDSDNAKITRQNRQSREELRARPKEEKVPAKRKRGGKDPSTS